MNCGKRGSEETRYFGRREQREQMHTGRKIKSLCKEMGGNKVKVISPVLWLRENGARPGV